MSTPMNPNLAIQMNGLTKTYKRGTKPALDSLDMIVNQGEIFGYLGPNGAGKTTTIRMLLDFIRPTHGHAQIFGLDCQKNSVEVHKRLGYLPGELNLWENQTGYNIVRYLGQLQGKLDMPYVNQLAERLKLDLSKTMRSYSTGNKRKIGLVIALMHKPELLILDEPTSGLDPLMQQTFVDMMREIRDEGRTVFLSSHMLSEVQAICERVAILRDGKLQAIERVSDLTRVKFHWVTIRFDKPVSGIHWAALPGVSEVMVNGNGNGGGNGAREAQGSEVKFRLSGDFDPILRAISSHYVVSVKTEEPSLEEIFLTFYGKDPKRTSQERQAVVAAANESAKEMVK